jgi:hypothetical protein
VPSRISRFAARRGWRALAMVGLTPAVVGLFGIAVISRSLWWTIAYTVVSATFLVIAWQIGSGGRDA